MAARDALISSPAYWRETLKLVGVWPTLGGALAVAGGLALTAPYGEVMGAYPMLRIVEIVVPLVVAWQATLLLTHETERPLELLLTFPRPVAFVLADRLGVIVALSACMALVANVATLTLPGAEALPLALARWIAGTGFLTGMALFLTQGSRQSALGVTFVTLTSFGLLFGGEALRQRWPFTWPILLYLQPEAVPFWMYLINRATLLLLGLGLIIWSLGLTRDEERVLALEGRSA